MVRGVLRRDGDAVVSAGGGESDALYRTSLAVDQTALRMRIREIAQARPRYGATPLGILLRQEGWRLNKKQMHRLYCLGGGRCECGSDGASTWP